MATIQDVNDDDTQSLEVRIRNLIVKNSQISLAADAPADAPPVASISLPQGSVQSQPISSPKPHRRRMNQAQRRQMSSQLSIAIDPHATEHQPSQLPSQSPGPNQPYQHDRRNNRSRSAAFQPTHINDGLASHSRPSPSSNTACSTSPSLPSWRQNSVSNAVHARTIPPNHYSRISPRHSAPFIKYRPSLVRAEDFGSQVALLDKLSADSLSDVEIDLGQIQEKENFRLLIEDACRLAIAHHETAVNGRANFPPLSVQLQCFGSLSSGFATRSSDMDLALLSPLSHPHPGSHDSPIPRLVEKVFLDMGLGARLLSKTRIPIIKVCQKPAEKFYSVLADERKKWEREDEPEPDEDEDIEKPTSSNPQNQDTSSGPSQDEQAPGANCGQSNEIVCMPSTDGQGVDEYHALINDLHQGAKSLPNYYAAAKRVLRKLGGKDVTSSTAATFSEGDFRILNDVCKAFVHGLADDTLRNRLEAYRSLAFHHAAPVPQNRSLFGVMVQVETEQTAMAWASREICEKDEYHEQLASNRFVHWKELQDKQDFGLDPLGFNREMLSAAESIKKTPSVGLLLLEQGQYESAALYHNRAIRLMIELGGYDSSVSRSPILSNVIRRYIQGIYDAEIRAHVADFEKSNPLSSLRSVARRHKALQLAREYERALEKGLYSSEDVGDIRNYIDLLQGLVPPHTAGGARFDYAVPMMPQHQRLLKKIREMPDPSHMSPNRPRDPYRDRLEFPKSGVGVQCDINFSAQLALQNTHLLRCYSLTDPRVRPLVLFVKYWSKVRGINTPYRGTLSSYGYVLMMLHYLVNVASPFVCPNLQSLAPPVDSNLSPELVENTVVCNGRDVRFWRNEDEIKAAAQQGGLTQNTDSIGHLLWGFFEYYAKGNLMSNGSTRGFDWGRDVISLRTQGGILTKQVKGWTGAKTILEVQPTSQAQAVKQPIPQPILGPGLPGQIDDVAFPAPSVSKSLDQTTAVRSSQDRGRPEIKEIRHRFLFAIEDPFELDHNVARTVNHNGIVAIRDEFRRAWRIIRSAGREQGLPEDLLQDVSLDQNNGRGPFLELLDEIHGQRLQL